MPHDIFPKGLSEIMQFRRSGATGSALLVALAVSLHAASAAQLRSRSGAESSSRDLAAVFGEGFQPAQQPSSGEAFNSGDNADSVCDPPCVPGRGVCDNNHCFCRSGFTGSTCQLKDKSSADGVHVEAGVAIGILFGAMAFGIAMGTFIFNFMVATCCGPTQYEDDNAQQEIWKPLDSS